MVSAPAWDGQVVSSTPGSVGYISHVHWAYDYLGPFGVLWVHMAWHKNCVKKSWLLIQLNFVQTRLWIWRPCHMVQPSPALVQQLRQQREQRRHSMLCQLPAVLDPGTSDAYNVPPGRPEPQLLLGHQEDRLLLVQHKHLLLLHLFQIQHEHARYRIYVSIYSSHSIVNKNYKSVQWQLLWMIELTCSVSLLHQAICTMRTPKGPE